MALLTIAETLAVLGDTSTISEDAAANAASSMTALIAKMTNRVLTMRVSGATVTDGSLELTVPGHRLSAGRKVRINTEIVGSDIDDVFTVATVVDRHRFTVDVSELDPALTQEALEAMTLLVRPVHRETHVVRGHKSIFVRYLPLAEVVSLSRADGNGGWTALEAAKYTLTSESNGVSLSGEIATIGTTLGTAGQDPIHAGALVEYVAGEPYVLWELVDAAKTALKESQRRGAKSGLQSESYDYFSYNRMTAEEAKQLFGNALHAIEAMRIPAA